VVKGQLDDLMDGQAHEALLQVPDKSIVCDVAVFKIKHVNISQLNNAHHLAGLWMDRRISSVAWGAHFFDVGSELLVGGGRLHPRLQKLTALSLFEQVNLGIVLIKRPDLDGGLNQNAFFLMDLDV